MTNGCCSRQTRTSPSGPTRDRKGTYFQPPPIVPDQHGSRCCAVAPKQGEALSLPASEDRPSCLSKEEKKEKNAEEQGNSKAEKGRKKGRGPRGRRLIHDKGTDGRRRRASGAPFLGARRQRTVSLARAERPWPARPAGEAGAEAESQYRTERHMITPGCNRGRAWAWGDCDGGGASWATCSSCV